MFVCLYIEYCSSILSFNLFFYYKYKNINKLQNYEATLKNEYSLNLKIIIQLNKKNFIIKKNFYPQKG